MTALRQLGPYVTIPWGNGLGASRELDGETTRTGDTTALSWRVSTTQILRDCPFSHYPGTDRTIVLLRGAGFRLDFGAQGMAIVDATTDQARFRGAWPTGCTLLDGPVEVFNVMVGEGLRVATVRRVSSGDTVRRVGVHPGTRLLYCASGPLRIALDGEEALAQPGDAYALLATETSRLTLERTGSALLVDIAPPGPA